MWRRGVKAASPFPGGTMDKSQGPITITLAEYEELLAAQEKLNMLEAFGVDRWDGYAAAMEAMEDEDGY